MRRKSIIACLTLAVIMVNCAPAQPERERSVASGSSAIQNRTLTVAHRYEPTNLAPKVLQTNGTFNTARLFNAALTLIGEDGIPRPYLAESLPQLNTDAWQVFPDGTMETRYTLARGLTWQDETPLTAEDFVFAFRVYKESGLQNFIGSPQDTIDSVLAADPRTVVIRWLSSNPNAGSLTFEELDPLPQHMLGRAFADFMQGRSSAEAFMADATWTGSYIGAGPYRLERWDPGVQLEGSAFSGHILGMPKIQRVVVRILVDENQTLGVVLTGGIVDYACCNTLRFPQFLTLKQEWEPSGKGTAIVGKGNPVFLNLQQRPAYVGHEALLDLRVRRALAHAVDRGAINDGVFNDLGSPTESPIPPDLPYFAEAERLMTRYPLDLAQAAELMSQAGFTRDGSGLFADRQGRRFHIDFTVQSGSDIEKMQTILSDSWRQAGFEVRPEVMAPQLFSQLETRHTVPGLGYSLFGGEISFLSSEIGSAANRWRGRNRTSWSSPEYDRLYDLWHGELDQTQRGSYIARMMALVSESVPGYTLYFPPTVTIWVRSLKGPSGREASRFGETSRPTTVYWNVQEWTFS